MICTKCKNDGVLNQANGKDFYFCKTCREEIVLEDKLADDEKKEITQQEIDEIFDSFYFTYGSSYMKQYITLQEYEQECLSISPHWSDKE